MKRLSHQAFDLVDGERLLSWTYTLWRYPVLI